MPDFDETSAREKLSKAIEELGALRIVILAVEKEHTLVKAELAKLTETTLAITKAMQKLHKVYGEEYDENLVPPGEILGVQFKDVSF